MQSNRPTFIRNHLGLGDFLVANAIFRHYAQTNGVLTACKFHNVPSVHFMLRDVPVAILGVNDDEGANKLVAVAERRMDHVLRLGMFGKGFDEKRWDQVMFEQAGIPFEKRWSEWKVERDLSREFSPQSKPYVFIHEDTKRGFKIDERRIPSGFDRFRVIPSGSDNIFDYCGWIENATELHMIDSCFAILADSLTTLKAKRKVIHLYARKNALPPTYKQDWEILR